jgi:hypothetical protein
VIVKRRIPEGVMSSHSSDRDERAMTVFDLLIFEIVFNCCLSWSTLMRMVQGSRVQSAWRLGDHRRAHVQELTINNLSLAC